MWHNFKLEDGTEFVLSNPNGWEGTQQSMIRTAAVRAGLIPDNEGGHSHLSVKLACTSVFKVILPTNPSRWTSFLERLSLIASGKGLLNVDAGGGTIDISASSYRRSSPHSQSYEEIAVPQCSRAFFYV